MKILSSPPRRGLLLFEREGSTNLVELDLKPCFTPMIWCLKIIQGFGLKKEKKTIREKRKIRKGNIFLFLLYFEELIFSLQKRMVKKWDIFSKLTYVNIRRKLKI